VAITPPAVGDLVDAARIDAILSLITQFGTGAQRDAIFGAPATLASQVALQGASATWFNTDRMIPERYYAPYDPTTNTVSPYTSAGWYPTVTPSARSVAQRNVIYPSPVQGNTCIRTDVGYTEQYFSAYNSSSNPVGATPAGWYPIINSPECHLTLTGSFSNVGGLVAFSGYTALLNQIGWWTSATNPSRITPNIVGLYRVSVTAAFAASASSARIIQLRKNGTIVLESRIDNPDASNATAITLRTILTANGTDYFELYYLQNSGAALASTGVISVDYINPIN
jgi:hypothetical protein